MKIRAVTLGFDLPYPVARADSYRDAGAFLTRAAAAFREAGVDVQTTRAAGPRLDGVLADLDDDAFLAWAAASERAVRDAGVNYLSLGLIPSAAAERLPRLVSAIASGAIAFLAGDLLTGGRPSVPMAHACAVAVRALAASTPLGFGNLRFSAVASCPPNIPFLPAAYHTGGQPRFSVAVQAADVALEALRGAGTVEEIEDRLVERLEAAVQPVEVAARRVAEESGVPFVGIDLSPAPYPTDDTSIGGALEAVGVDRFGAPGTVFAAALVTRAIRRTRLQRSGFSGLMLPVLEDSVLARRVAERPASLHGLLLYSAVCGTGLDTVPVPGDISEAALTGAYLDVAALSIALGGKPLTARFLPVPDAAAGDLTAYDFEFFHNTRVLPVASEGASGILARHA